MLDGLEVAVLKFSEMDLGSRIDAEYFSKENLTVQNTLKQKQSKRFAEYAKFVSSAFYPAATHLYESGVVPFIRCVDCVNYPVISKLQDESFERIPLEFLEDHDSVHKLDKGEIVITKVGTPCYASIVHEHDFVALSRTVFGVKDIKGIDPYYLVAFLRSRYGFQQLQREREQTIQFQLTLDRVRDILIFEPSKEFQKKVGQTLKSSFAKLEQSKRLYAEAEETLLEELGLKNIDIAESQFNIGRFSNIEVFGRMDAEYYKRKYENLLSYISSKDNFTLEQIADFSGGATPLGAAYQESGVPFLRIQNIGENKLVLDDVAFIDEETHKGLLNRSQLAPRDVLLTITGRIGTTAVVPEGLYEANINQHIVRMRLKDKSINPYYLAAFLNSIGGKLQTEREAYGTTREALPYYCLSKIRVLKADKGFQNQIEKMILKADAAEQESKRLLEVSKRAVEVAIERSELRALVILSRAKNL